MAKHQFNDLLSRSMHPKGANWQENHHGYIIIPETLFWHTVAV